VFVPSVFIFATAAVTAFLIGEKLRWYGIAAGFLVLGLTYFGGVIFLTRLGVAPILWQASLPLAAFAPLYIWYRAKRGWVSAAFFVVLPPVAIVVGFAVTGLAGESEWVKRLLSLVALRTGYGGCTVPGLTRFFFITSALLYLSTPANAIIKGVLKRLGVFPVVTARDTGADTAARGAIIGTLERWIAFVLVLTGQYTALAFVIAAKSIARYKKINEEEKFGEYFLIGTLTSIGIALFVGIIIKNFLA